MLPIQSASPFNLLEKQPGDQQATQLKKQCDRVGAGDRSTQFCAFQVVIKNYRERGDSAEAGQARYLPF